MKVIVAGVAILLGTIWAIPQADARSARAHPYHRSHGRWVNGVWVDNCSYYYQKWENTRRKYWHDRYYKLCRNWGS
jgi:hypothetical protein